MSINFNQKFGANSNTSVSSDRETVPCKVWLNIGYVSDVADDDTGDFKFVSLPMGLPLDTMEPTATRGNTAYAQLQAAGNDLHAQLMSEAEKLAPGEDMIIGIDAGLSIQIRRVSDAVETANDDSNGFVKKLVFNRN